jgi:hypothetical protein
VLFIKTLLSHLGPAWEINRPESTISVLLKIQGASSSDYKGTVQNQLDLEGEGPGSCDTG